jgi:DNA-binding response OmpR family regulator
VTSQQPGAARLRVEPANRRVLLDGRPVSLTTQELALLTALCRRAVVSRDELRRAAELGSASHRRVDGILVGLRRQLGQGAIRTVRGRGWMLELSHEVVEGGA